MTDQPPKSRGRIVERVRCLDCGNLYAKPSAGGTVEENPGCPHCGYIGWIAAGVEIIPPVVPLHSVVDRLQGPADRLH